MTMRRTFERVETSINPSHSWWTRWATEVKVSWG
jgi:hypothetical protein